MAKIDKTNSKTSNDATFVLTTTHQQLRRNPIGELRGLHKVLAEVGNKGRMVMYSNDITSSIIDCAVEGELVHRYVKSKVKDPKRQLKMMEGEKKVREALVMLMEGINDMRSIAGMGKKGTKSKKRNFVETEVGEGFQNENLKKKEEDGKINASDSPAKSNAPKKEVKPVEGFSLDD